MDERNVYLSISSWLGHYRQQRRDDDREWRNDETIVIAGQATHIEVNTQISAYFEHSSAIAIGKCLPSSSPASRAANAATAPMQQGK
jgi:hypothetical protein